MHTRRLRTSRKISRRRRVHRGGADLFDAIAENNATLLSELIREGADVNQLNQKGETALMTAISSKNTNIAKLLLDAPGIDVNKANRRGEIPLSFATLYGNETIVKMLLAMPEIDINKTNHYGGTPLYVAVYNNNINIVKLLLSLTDIDVNKATETGDTPLFTAAEYRRDKILKLLLDVPDIDVNSYNKKGATPLIVSIADGNVDIIKRLLEVPGIDVNLSDNNGYTPLMVSIRNANVEIVELLLAAPDIDVNKASEDGYTPLTFAISDRNGSIDIVELLLAAPDIDVNKPGEDGYTPLNIAIVEDLFDIVELLLDAPDIDVNETNQSGETPLMIATAEGNSNIVEMLLAAPGIDVNKKTEQGVSPLFIAAQTGNIEIVKLLLDAPEIDVNNADEDGMSPLYYAAKNGFDVIVKMLLKAGAIVDTTITEYMDSFSPKIKEIFRKHASPASPPMLWPGFSKNDSEKLGLLFEENINATTLATGIDNEVLYSHCPICLKYISHDEASCMYMTHNCEELGGYYHEELFNRYKHRKHDIMAQPTGKYVISWCTLCGRICQGHQHYKLDSYDTPSPTLLKAGSPYETDCRKTNGGGGWPEKAERHRRLREYALELNEQVGEITTEDALNQLVEEMWNAPLQRKARALRKMEADRAFNVGHAVFPNLPYNQFPNVSSIDSGNASLSNNIFKIRNKTFKIKNNVLYTKTANSNTRKANAPYQYYYERYKKAAAEQLQPTSQNIPYPNVGNPELLPIVYYTAPDGFVDPTYSDVDDNVVQFRHRMADGTINNHANPATDMIGKDMLLLQINSAIQNGELSKIGPCWQPECTAKLYPQELKAVIDGSYYADAVQKEADVAIYEKYRYEFNKKYATA